MNIPTQQEIDAAGQAAKPDLVEIINEAFAKTGPKALQSAIVAVAERVQALEKELGA